MAAVLATIAVENPGSLAASAPQWARLTTAGNSARRIHRHRFAPKISEMRRQIN